MINFKKSIILTMMVSILAPQVAFACKDDASCQPAVNDHINKVVRNASKKLPSSIREEFINILYQALTKKYKGECFINNKAAKAAGVVAAVVAGGVALTYAVGAGITEAGIALGGDVFATILPEATAEMAGGLSIGNSLLTAGGQIAARGVSGLAAIGTLPGMSTLGAALAGLGLTGEALGIGTLGFVASGAAEVGALATSALSGAAILGTTAALGGNAQGSTTIGGTIANDPALQEQVTKVCNKIAKKLGTHFYAKSGACWGNGTGEKLKFKLIEKNKKDPQIIDLSSINNAEA
jgi:hypothetical protein